MESSREIGRLLEIMAALRTPVTGCAWDLAQTFASIVPFTIEEAYEVADAVERGDLDDLKDELGDLLLQVVFQARIAEEQGAFAFGDVVEAITRKLIRRHPHIFGTTRDLSPEQVKVVWAAVKAAEKAGKRPIATDLGLLADVPNTLPALTRATKLQAKAATVGFDWPDPIRVIDKIREETDEVVEALSRDGRAGLEGEIGDLLFAVVNLARKVGIDPEAALRGGNAKFARRFGHIEGALGRQGLTLAAADLDMMEALWVEAKQAETASASAIDHPANDSGLSPS